MYARVKLGTIKIKTDPLRPCMYNILVDNELIGHAVVHIRWSSGEATVWHNQLKSRVPDISADIDPTVDKVSNIHLRWVAQSQ